MRVLGTSGFKLLFLQRIASANKPAQPS